MPELHPQRLTAVALGAGDTGPATALLGPLPGTAVTLRAVRHPHEPPGSPLLLHRAVAIHPRSRLQVTEGPGGAGDQLATPALSAQTVSQQKTVLMLANKAKSKGHSGWSIVASRETYHPGEKRSLETGYAPVR